MAKGLNYVIIVVGIYSSAEILQRTLQKMEAEIRTLIENRTKKQKAMQITINPLTYVGNIVFVAVNMIHKKPDDAEVLLLSYTVRDMLRECGAHVVLEKDTGLLYNENILVE
jgi:predicted Co/Zn/Cd cation transporter (cation efflux family)